MFQNLCNNSKKKKEKKTESLSQYFESASAFSLPLSLSFLNRPYLEIQKNGRTYLSPESANRSLCVYDMTINFIQFWHNKYCYMCNTFECDLLSWTALSVARHWKIRSEMCVNKRVKMLVRQRREHFVFKWFKSMLKRWWNSFDKKTPFPPQ